MTKIVRSLWPYSKGTSKDRFAHLFNPPTCGMIWCLKIPLETWEWPLCGGHGLRFQWCSGWRAKGHPKRDPLASLGRYLNILKILKCLFPGGSKTCQNHRWVMSSAFTYIAYAIETMRNNYREENALSWRKDEKGVLGQLTSTSFCTNVDVVFPFGASLLSASCLRKPYNVLEVLLRGFFNWYVCLSFSLLRRVSTPCLRSDSHGRFGFRFRFFS